MQFRKPFGRLHDREVSIENAYVAKFGDDVVVLHYWQKKSKETADSDKKTIVKLYREYQETER